MGRGDTDIPVAKLADDNWVTAMVACPEASSADSPTVPVGSGEGDNRQETTDSPPVSLLRWRSARAIARQTRRMGSETTTRFQRSSGTGSTSDRPEGGQEHIDQMEEDVPSNRNQDSPSVPSEVPS